MLHRGLVAELTTNTLSAPLLVTAGADFARIFPQKIPQKKRDGDAQMPCVVFAYIATERQVTYCGTSGLVRTVMRLDCYGVTYDDSKALAIAVRGALIDYAGLLGGVVDLRAASLENETDLHDFEPGLYRVTQTWVFWHNEIFVTE
jgi:hypothetical protein